MDLGNFTITAPTGSAEGPVVLAVRPEDIFISTTPMEGAVDFNAYSVLPAGADTTIIAHKGEVSLTIRVSGISHIKMDEKIWLKFDSDTINIYDKETGILIDCGK